jgi:hypothetical protein
LANVAERRFTAELIASARREPSAGSPYFYGKDAFAVELSSFLLRHVPQKAQLMPAALEIYQKALQSESIKELF